MKSTLAVAAFVAMTLTAPVRAQEKLAITPELVSAAEQEGEVTLLYSSPLNAMHAFVEAFNQEYPNITVNLERKAGSAGVQMLLEESQAGVHRIDVFQGTDAGANATLVKENLFVAVEPEEVEQFLPSALPMAPYLYYPDRNRSLIMYNPNYVTEEEAAKLQSWEGILDPAFRDKISLVEPTFGVTLAPLLYIMETPSLGEDFLRKLKQQNPTIFVNTAQARDAVISGQKPISWGAQWESVAFSEFERGAPIRFAYPKPTVEYGTNGWGVLANAPHPNAARLFYAWGVGRGGATAMQGPAYNGLPALKKVEDGRAVVAKLKSESWFKFPEEVWNPNLDSWINNGTAYQQTWTKIMKSAN
ncbi:extracellular solute-binding protein [Mesorhizobium sp. J18]|uniref:ABC transporter substrate-binding protein n=1 Tax=Mesorhizobium sp. J18 TaxID=935263 RepID=UPI001646E5A3|nr:extracellular solute-binding protein [Mesorhizobium sp. J18]